MSANSNRAREIFLAALKMAPDDWEAYLNEVCGHDQKLRSRVQNLLDAHQQADSFLEPAVPGLVSIAKEPVAERPGTMIGPYKLLEPVGEGGFGIVFMAEQQQPMRRNVALKVIKPGMDTKQVVARFEAERQALALMDHPHIARVLDAGATDSGRPYFVMELVRGIPITQFCDDNRLTPRERLQLFVTVCEAVQHAHQKGIIHRDLKPSNVLVTLLDGTPVVKVIDFGIAKALGRDRLTDKTLVTGVAHMLGTPLYMSPEQAEMNGQDADTRTDIYSLGVLLYELLTGTTPFDKDRLKEASYDEIRRIIREEEPAKPSTRISTLGQVATTASTNRKSEPKRLSQLFRGELDWIVMKALEKDRNRRYDTASSVAADVQRYLHDEPVLACPPSALYRFRKFARRHKAALLTMSAVGCTLLLAIMSLAASTVLVVREKAQTDATKEQLQQALGQERLTSYYQRIALAEREWSANNLGGMEQLLDACPSDLRGWEWHYLRRLPYKHLPDMRHDAAVFQVAVSPDGNRIASCSQDGIIKVWDVQTGQELRRIRAHPTHARSVAFSPDARWLASASWDGIVKIWDAQTVHKVGHDLEGHQQLWSIAFSPDGKLLACGDGRKSDRGEVKLWDTSTWQKVSTLRGHSNGILCLAFSSDSQRLASGSFDSTITLWDVRTGEEKRTIRDEEGPVFSVAFSPDGHLLASCTWWGNSRTNGHVKVWNAETGEELLHLDRHTRGVCCLAFSPDGRRLASGSLDQTVKLWDVATGAEALTLRGHLEAVRSVVFSPDGNRLFSCGHDHTVRVWDARPLGGEEDEECITLRGHRGEVISVAFHPTHPDIVGSTGTDGTLKLWSLRTKENLRTSHVDTGEGIVSLAFSPDGHRVATAGDNDKALRVWDAASDRLVKLLTGVPDGEQSVAFFPDGRQIVSAGIGRTVSICDVDTGKVVHAFPRQAWTIPSVACSPDGKHVVAAMGGGTIRIWMVRTRQEVVESPLQHGGECSVAFSKDGKLLASAGLNRLLKIWDSTTWKTLHVLHDPTGGATSVAFSPDGQRVAWGGTDSTVKVWEARTRQIHVLRGHTNWVHGVAFSPDGKQIASASADGTLKVWNVPPLRASTEAADK